MRALLLAISTPDPGPLRAALGAALGATSVDACHAVEAAVTWLENRPCDLIAIAGPGAAVADAVARVRRVSRTIPVLAVMSDVATLEAGTAWLAGADDVITASGLTAAQLPDGLDEVRHPERQVLRRMQRLWYAGAADSMRQHLATRVGSRFRDVGLSGEGLAGLTTQDVEETHSAALLVNAAAEPGALVLGVRLVKRAYPGLAITVVAEGIHHDAFRRAGADECLAPPADVDHVLHAVGRAQAQCRASLELDLVRARETRLRAVLEQLPEAVVLVSPEHAVQAVNLAALRLLGAQDARQVVGSSLTPWLDADAADAPDVATLVDSVASGTGREIFMRTRHLAEALRLQLRAVPFQRESGGPPAALVVLREVPTAFAADQTPLPAPDAAAALDEARREWEVEREALSARVASLSSELESLRGLEDALQEARVAAAKGQDDLAELAVLREMAARLDACGVAIATIPDLVQAAGRLATLEQELPVHLAQAQEVQGKQEEDLQALAATLDDARHRIQELETALASALSDNPLPAPSAACPDDDGTTPVPVVDVPDEEQWLVQEIAGIGVIRTNRAGQVLEANESAARLCGHASATALLHANRLPEPLLDAGGGAESAAARFEICLQVDGRSAPWWLAGVRAPATSEADTITWLLAEHGALRDLAPRDVERQLVFSSVLEAAAAECRTLVETAATRISGPRPVDDTGLSDHTAGTRALARAQVMLSQLSTYGRRRGATAAAHDVRQHLQALQPVLRRLATDDVEWRLEVGGPPAHACIAPADFERCVTSMVTSTRDALPLGGQLTMTLDVSQAGASASRSDVWRPEVLVSIEAQGYGLVDVHVPSMLHELASAAGAYVEITRVDTMTSRLRLRLPRAYVLSHVA